MKTCCLMMVLALCATNVFAQKDDASTLQKGIALYLEGVLSEAVPTLRDAIAEQPNNPDAFAWLAEALRYDGSDDESQAMARRALELSPCHAQAHTTLGNLYNPETSWKPWEQVSFDSTRAHLMQAVACDSTEGEAWLGLWIEAMRRRDQPLEQKSLDALASSGFVTPGALAYAQWKLASLPENAILLTVGDLDTYPLVVLQRTKGFRTDVAVVSTSLLNRHWYAALMTERHGITGGYSAKALEKLKHLKLAGDSYNTISQQVVHSWIEARRRGELKRPITIAAGVDRKDFGDVEHFTLAGPFWLYSSEKTPKRVDLDIIWESLRTLDASGLNGYMLSRTDRSWERRYETHGSRTRLVIALELAGVVHVLYRVDKEEAYKLMRWVADFDPYSHLFCDY